MCVCVSVWRAEGTGRGGEAARVRGFCLAFICIPGDLFGGYGESGRADDSPPKPPLLLFAGGELRKSLTSSENFVYLFF